MIFLTVGTQFPFDRLVKGIDKAIEQELITERVYGQIGNGAYQPRNFVTTATLEKALFDEYVRRACCIIGHAGTGTIITAIENDKPLLVMPRQKKYGEVVNDHQLTIAGKFEESGHILVAYNERQLNKKIEQLKTFVPRKRKVQPKMAAKRIAEFLSKVGVQS